MQFVFLLLYVSSHQHLPMIVMIVRRLFLLASAVNGGMLMRWYRGVKMFDKINR